jgi:N-acyl homoserine lactone hydrolase
MNYKIKALKCGEQLVPGPEIFHMSRWYDWIKVNMYFWYITNGKTKILIDTGIRDPDEINKIIIPEFGEKAKFFIPKGYDLISGLKNNSLTPDDIDYVIITHFHYDHLSNIKLFNNARIIISRKGFINSLCPKHKSMINHPLFPKDIFLYFLDDAKDRLILAEEEEEILPGIKLFWVGGHTMCSQAVKIETENGKVVLTGDIVFLYENIEKNIPVGLMYNLIECLDGMKRIRDEADIILPGHDPQILVKYPEGDII